MTGHSRQPIGVGLVLAAFLSGGLLRAQLPQPVGTWASIGATSDSRVGAAAVPLADGRTLIAGGSVDGAPADTVIVYDPADGTITNAGRLLAPRVGHTATLLDDGRVLVAGGMVNDLLNADLELFDPSSGTSTLVATLAQLRSGHAAARLADGTVLIVGGTGTDGVLQSGELFDPSTGAVTMTASAMQTPRTGASATTLIDGRVLIAGGSNGGADLASAEIYDPSSQSFQPTDTALSVPRSGHVAVLLPHNNGVLIAGGSSSGAPQRAADVFLPAEFPDPYTYGIGRFAPTGAMAAARSGAVGGPHVEGYAFVAGGGASDTEVYRFATIKTDKDDYAPGERAIITGSGWQPSEEVTLLFQEDPAVHDDYVLTVTADSEGNIYWDQWAPEEHDLGVRFYLMARDSKSRAQITFTDHTPHGTHTFQFQISGLGIATSITIDGSRNIPGSGHAVTAYPSVTFTSPGPSGGVGAAITILSGPNALASTLTFSGFPASVPGVGGDYNLVSTSHSSPISVPTTTGTTVVTATYEFVPSDTTPPEVTINQAVGQGDPTKASPINFTAVFNEPVTGFTGADVAFTGSTAGGTLVAAVSEVAPNDGTTYNVAVSGMTSSGTVVASIPAGGATDAAGNGNNASSSTDNFVTYDITPPEVTINQAAGQADPTNASPINFTAMFSEPVTGFTGADVAFTGSTTGGTFVATVTEVAPNDGTTYNVAVSGMTSSGTVVASIPAGGATDAAGNGNNASSSTDNVVTYDITPPTVAITSPSAGQNTIASSIAVSGTADDVHSGILSVTVNGVATTYAGGAWSTNSHVPLTCGSNTITATATDNAGNTNTQSITVNRLCFTFEYLKPLDESYGAGSVVINDGKYGRVVPVKGVVKLNGLPQTAADLQAFGLTVRIGVNGVYCSGAWTDELQEYSDAGLSSNGTNIFRWTLDGFWAYSLDTKAPPDMTMTINNCYRLDAYVQDTATPYNKMLISASPYAIFRPVR